MKFEKINGNHYIILEENDRIFLTTLEELDNTDIKVERKDNGINISGDSSLVNSIRGDGMLEKVYIPPIVSAQVIVEKCDKWLEMFRKIHDKFKELVLSEKYRKQDISMNLTFERLISLDGNMCKTISLNLMQYGIIIQEGVTITVDEVNEDIYAYLVVNVLDYYISQNYADSEIDYLKYWDWNLYSSAMPREGEPVPIFSNLSLLRESSDYEKIVLNIIGNHNLGRSSNQIIFNIRNRISNQQISDITTNSINYSANQYEHIAFDLSKEDKGPVLSKTLNPNK